MLSSISGTGFKRQIRTPKSSSSIVSNETLQRKKQGQKTQRFILPQNRDKPRTIKIIGDTTSPSGIGFKDVFQAEQKQAPVPVLKSILKQKTTENEFVSLDPPVVKKTPKINFSNLFEKTPRESEPADSTERQPEVKRPKLGRSRRKFKRVGKKIDISENPSSEDKTNSPDSTKG